MKTISLMLALCASLTVAIEPDQVDEVVHGVWTEMDLNTFNGNQRQKRSADTNTYEKITPKSRAMQRWNAFLRESVVRLASLDKPEERRRFEAEFDSFPKNLDAFVRSSMSNLTALVRSSVSRQRRMRVFNSQALHMSEVIDRCLDDDFDHWRIEAMCKLEMGHSPFRTMSGICNNLGTAYCHRTKDPSYKRRLWGASGLAMTRLIPPKSTTPSRGLSKIRGRMVEEDDEEYYNEDDDEEEEEEEEEQLQQQLLLDNGFDDSTQKAFATFTLPDITQSRAGLRLPFLFGRSLSSLPPARTVSWAIHRKEDSGPDSVKLSHMFMQMGQFVDHDISFTPENELGEEDDCCKEGRRSDDKCTRMEVKDDPFFDKENGVKCIKFARSLVHCKEYSDSKENMNTLTAFIDASNVYGSDEEQMKGVRGDAKDGKLAVSEEKTGDFPVRVDGDHFCGDSRCGEQPGLLSIHTLFVRLHNQLIHKLPKHIKDPHLKFQVVRRIVSALMQHLVYNEWLPVALGPTFYRHFKLGSWDWSKYNSCTDPTVMNEFATAAFRFGHSLIRDKFGKCNMKEDEKPSAATCEKKAFFLKDNFMTEGEAVKGLDETVQGQCIEAAKKRDEIVAKAVVDTLFRNKQDPHVVGDLVARNIMRGRDHNLPGYVHYRQRCRLSVPKNWDDRPRQISENIWEKLKKLYAKPEDIDLFVGGMAERNVKGGQVGPTFACIISWQFAKLKFGDRYFFTHFGEAGSFKGKQLRHLVQLSLRDVICATSNVQALQKKIFLQPHDKYNPLVTCDHRRHIDVELLAHVGKQY